MRQPFKGFCARLLCHPWMLPRASALRSRAREVGGIAKSFQFFPILSIGDRRPRWSSATLFQNLHPLARRRCARALVSARVFRRTWGMGVAEMLDARDPNLSLASRETANAVSPLRSPSCGDPLSEVLGRRLRWLRVERGSSREQVAERLRVAVEHVQEHERGTRRMEPRELAAYARLLRVRISDFFKEPPMKGTA